MTAIILYLSHVVLFFYLGRKYAKQLIEGLKGDNNKWDAPEIITGLWIVLFPSMVLANLFLDYEISNGILASMDLILAFSLGGRAYLETIKSKKS